MGEQLGPVLARRLTGGRITGVPEHIVGLEESPDCVNIDPSSYRGAATRSGRTQHLSNNGSTATSVNGIAHWTKNDNTTFILFAASNNVFVSSITTWASSFLGATIGGAARFAPLNNILVMVGQLIEPASPPQKTSDGITWANLGGSPPSTAYYIAQYKSKLFLAGDPGNPQKISFCVSNNPEDWTTANNAGSITIDTGGGDKIRGLLSTRNGLVIFFRHAVHVLFGDSTFNYWVAPVSKKGATSESGFAVAGEIAFFASDDGIYSIRGAEVSLVSIKVQKDYADISDKSKVTLAVKNDKLFVFAWGESSPFALVLDYRKGVWSRYSDQPFKSVTPSQQNDVYGGTSGSTLQVWKLEDGTADGASAIAARWVTPDMDFDRWDAMKTLSRYQVHANPGLPTTTVTFLADGASIASTHVLTFTTTGRHEYSAKAFPQSLKTARHLSMRLDWTGAGTLYGFAIYATLRDDPDSPARED